MVLLQKKFDQVKKYGDLWKIDDREKPLSLSIEDQLYHHSYISILLEMACKEKWIQLRKILLMDVVNIETRIEELETFRRKQQKLITDIEIGLAEQQCAAASTASGNSSEGN